MQKSQDLLLQIGEIFVSTKLGRIITDRGRFITNRDGYYKSGQIIESGAQNVSIEVRSFLLTLKTQTMNFEINIFCNILKDHVHGQVYSKKYQKLIPGQDRCFLGDNPFGTSSSPKASRNCLWQSDFLIKTQDQDYSHQPKTLLRCFHKSVLRPLLNQLHQKLWKIYSKTHVMNFPLDKIAWLQSTTYYRTKNYTTDYFS